MENKNLFCVSVTPYDARCTFSVYAPASLDRIHDHAVCFVMERFAPKAAQVLLTVTECLVFWPQGIPVPPEVAARHAISPAVAPRLEFCRFFRDNGINALPPKEPFDMVEGAFIAKGVHLPQSCTVMPGAYICSGVTLGQNVYIGAGAKIVCPTIIGDDTIIRENVVLGAAGLTTDRDADGSGIPMPQFGGLVIGREVQIGAGTVIARGAIDDTVIGDGCKLDNNVFVSHNVRLGKNTFVVGETIFFGSSSTGEGAYISGNCTIRNKIAIGEGAFVGMGAVVTRDVPPHTTVAGNPAKGRE